MMNTMTTNPAATQMAAMASMELMVYEAMFRKKESGMNRIQININISHHGQAPESRSGIRIQSHIKYGLIRNGG
jgi:hypothetical protein